MPIRILLFAAAMMACGIVQPAQAAESQNFPLETIKGLDFLNVTAKPVVYQGRKAIRVVAKPPAGGAGPRGAGPRGAAPRGMGGARESLTILADTDFKNGTIEIEMAGSPNTNAGQAARGFVGLAFRVQRGRPVKYECFYLRPTNGRADDQERRNHAVQYISHPLYTWMKLRKESPSKYESYTDLVSGRWTKVKIVVSNLTARLYVDDAEQPCLIVTDLKKGDSSGPIALWQNSSTIAHFRNLTITPAP